MKTALTYWVMPTSAPAGPSRTSTTYLLPNYDEFLIAYKDRDEVLGAPSDAERSAATTEEPPHHVIVDGLLAELWRRVSNDPRRTQVDVNLFAPNKSARNQRELAAAGGGSRRFSIVPSGWRPQLDDRPHGERRIDAHG